MPVSSDKEVVLGVGKRMLVVGANEAGIGKFRVAGEDRYDFLDVGSLKKLTDLPKLNYSYAIANGHIPSDVMGHLEDLVDRSKSKPTLVVTENGGSLVKMMENFPVGRKGVATFVVPQVVRTIECVSPEAARANNKPVQSGDGMGVQSNGQSSGPAKKEPAEIQQDTSPQAPSPPPAPKLSVNELLEQLEKLYDRFDGDHKKIISYIMEECGKDCMTYGALYQRILKIRRARDGGNAKRKNRQTVDLFGSKCGEDLLSAIEAARTANARVLDLAVAAANENVQLKGAVSELKGENALLRSQLQAVFQAAQKAFTETGGNG